MPQIGLICSYTKLPCQLDHRGRGGFFWLTFGCPEWGTHPGHLWLMNRLLYTYNLVSGLDRLAGRRGWCCIALLSTVEPSSNFTYSRLAFDSIALPAYQTIDENARKSALVVHTAARSTRSRLDRTLLVQIYIWKSSHRTSIHRKQSAKHDV
jgi:hypothetical protein